jgi:hypothetical protein
MIDGILSSQAPQAAHRIAQAKTPRARHSGDHAEASPGIVDMSWCHDCAISSDRMEPIGCLTRVWAIQCVRKLDWRTGIRAR